MSNKWRIAGIEFSHMHMGDLLRCVDEHPNAEIVGICDPQPERMREAQRNFSLSDAQLFTDYRTCLEETKPDLVILCPPTAEHALWVERVAPYGVHVFVEKPFAGSLDEADRMVEAMKTTGKLLVINWPLRWVEAHVTTHRLIGDGLIGDVIEVHYYDGNRGPLYHGADKVEREPSSEAKQESWWYKKESAGGSLCDYLGYGVTLGTWFNGGKKPLEVTSVVSGVEGIEVDEHSITIARYQDGLSKFETRWGTFTDPWTHQPQPKCGFVVRGTEGTISSYDYESNVRIQTRKNPEGYELPVDPHPKGEANGIEYVLTKLENGDPIEGPLSPSIARIGQQIVDTAIESSETGKTIPLKGE
ncbi:Gfo/Idh/MocA family protein [Pelagicoccus mobilis]|uniref:Gfo/Idh/MocA family oxidoreductase n=1 Tax=Pelagicoccus mobilis TaxID=415221 RepID=A0A934RWC2_9BACT|nr:Gfo/Idh/MocA family oxidoreductase [Pelagicoccus mobilis]MBK1875986.1 Gfo/Idh/MocA family oxidoreductase [Pelagicoccus mobilis]